MGGGGGGGGPESFGGGTFGGGGGGGRGGEGKFALLSHSLDEALVGWPPIFGTIYGVPDILKLCLATLYAFTGCLVLTKTVFLHF